MTTLQSSEGAPGTVSHHLHAPPLGSAAQESLNDDENDFNENLETFEGCQNQSSDLAPQSDTNQPQSDEPEQDFDQSFIESLYVDDDCDYESDDCPSA